MRAVIFNSGMGSRMGGLTRLQPKCMAALCNGETIFARQVRILSACGIREFVVTTGPFAQQIEDRIVGRCMSLRNSLFAFRARHVLDEYAERLLG